MVRKYCSPTPNGRLIKYVFMVLALVLAFGLLMQPNETSASDGQTTASGLPSMTNNISDSTYAKGYLIQYNFKFDSAKINKGDKFTFTVKNTDTSKTLPGIETSNVAVYVASSGDAFAISSTDDNNGTTTITLTANQPQDYYDGLLNPEVKVMMQTTGNTDNTGYIKQQKEKTVASRILCK